jgi:hypothetical protein
MRNQDRGKRLIAVFLLGLVLLNFPLLAVVEAGQRLFGLPPLFLGRRPFASIPSPPG